MTLKQLHSPVGEVDGVCKSTGSLLNRDVVCSYGRCRGESGLQRSKQGHGFSEEAQHGEVFEIQQSLSRDALKGTSCCSMELSKLLLLDGIFIRSAGRICSIFISDCGASYCSTNSEVDL